MAKTKQTKKFATPKKTTFDTMSVTVLLVMTIFGGLIGYYLGKGSTSPHTVTVKEAGMMMREKGMMMEDAGRLMENRGEKMNDRELLEKGKMMMESGSIMSGKGSSMMGMTEGY
jgi:hypothetical protein